MSDTTTVYVGIGNSDGKLDQPQWNAFVGELRYRALRYRTRFLGEWFSLPDEPYQNAEFAWEMRTAELDDLCAELAKVRDAFKQDSIALAIVERTELI